MKSKKVNRFVILLAFFAMMTSFSSCQRGYGCPNNFSVSDTAVEVVKTAVKTIVRD